MFVQLTSNNRSQNNKQKFSNIQEFDVFWLNNKLLFVFLSIPRPIDDMYRYIEQITRISSAFQAIESLTTTSVFSGFNLIIYENYIQRRMLKYIRIVYQEQTSVDILSIVHRYIDGDKVEHRRRRGQRK